MTRLGWKIKEKRKSFQNKDLEFSIKCLSFINKSHIKGKFLHLLRLTTKKFLKKIRRSKEFFRYFYVKIYIIQKRTWVIENIFIYFRDFV